MHTPLNGEPNDKVWKGRVMERLDTLGDRLEEISGKIDGFMERCHGTQESVYTRLRESELNIQSLSTDIEAQKTNIGRLYKLILAFILALFTYGVFDLILKNPKFSS